MQPDSPLETQVELQFGTFAGAAAHRTALRPAALKRWVAAALRHPAAITVRVVGEAEGRELNFRHRGRDYATNVLTFDYGDGSADIVLCAPVVAREARAQGKALAAHYAHLVVHGTLHAQGYDHEAGEREAMEMEAVEILLLGMLGVANPY